MWKLGLLARLTVRRAAPAVVAVTGSVGKTSTKEAIGTVLAARYRVRTAPKSFNNEIGVPLTVVSPANRVGGAAFWIGTLLRACARLVVPDRAYPEVLVLEYAIDRPGDMDRLVRIAPPDVAVMTAMGDVPVHVEFFTGPEAVLHEKSKLLKALSPEGVAVLNADEPKVAGLRPLARGRVVTYGFSEGADMRITSFSQSLAGGEATVHFKLAHGGTVVPVRLRGALGRPEAYAAAAAAAVGVAFKLNLVEISQKLESYTPPPGRFRVLPGVRGTTLIDSTYNASPRSMEEALETVSELPAKRRIAVLGDMLELGRFTLEAHERLGRKAAKTVDLLAAVGHRAKFMTEAALAAGAPKSKVQSFLTLADAARYLEGILKPGDLVLFKASQGVRLERILKRFLAEPARAAELLVRQEPRWLSEAGLYDEGELV